MPIKDSAEGQKALAIELYDRFHAMKTYGKEPESLESITRIFKKDLGQYSTEKIINAISTHAGRSDEFPTVADIIGLIKRNGKPPIKESDIIAIRKKEGEFRTGMEWEMLREWEDQQQNGWRDAAEFDDQKHKDLLSENIRLRQQIVDLRDETKRLADLLRDERMGKGLEKPPVSLENKIQKTVKAMRQMDASESDIAEFLKPYGLENEGALAA